MNVEDMILISVDDHIVEPPTLFDNHLPDKWKDYAPKFVRKDDGTDVWQYEGNEMPNIGLNAVAGKPPEEYGIDPTSLDEIRRGCWDVDYRVKDMNLNGVLASMNFPSFVQFCGQLFSKSKDLDMGLNLLRAYNDWHIDEWCGSHPGRFIPLSIPPIWDPQLMADEVRRVAKKGCDTVTFSENPAKLGWPNIFGDHWDPFFAACEDEGMVICLHIGSSSTVLAVEPGAPIDMMITLTPLNTMHAATDLVWSQVFASSRTSSSRSRRAARGGSRTGSSGSTTRTSSTSSGPTRTSATGSRATSCATTSRSASSATRTAWTTGTRSASTRSRGSATTRTPTPRGRTRPRHSPSSSPACPTTRWPR